MKKEDRAGSWRLATRLVHAGLPARVDGDTGYALSPPIWQTATFGFDRTDAAKPVSPTIPRPTTPVTGIRTSRRWKRRWPSSKGPRPALVTGSGMGAISLVFLGLLAPGDHVVAQKTHYVGTVKLLHHWLPRLGIECTTVDQTDPALSPPRSGRRRASSTPNRPSIRLSP